MFPVHATAKFNFAADSGYPQTMSMETGDEVSRLEAVAEWDCFRTVTEKLLIPPDL